MPTTSLGIEYPDSSGHARTWEYWQALAEDVDALLVAIKGSYEGAWGSYTPVWSGVSGTGPSLGNGTITGAYKRIGNTVFVRTILTLGSTSSAGSGTVYCISLPVAAKIGSLIPIVCTGSGGNPYAGAARITAATTGGNNMRMSVTDAQAVGNAVPFTWVNGFQLYMAGSYEADA